MTRRSPLPRKRAATAQPVATGAVNCARCGEPIEPGELWDLGHVDGTGKRRCAGAEHRACNRRAGAEQTNAARNAFVRRVSRAW